MMNQDRWQLPDGVDELLPQQASAAEIMRRAALDLFASWGYAQIEPPLIEFTDSLLIGMGDDIALQSFRLTDQVSGRPMAVRADISAQAARIDAHSMQAKDVNRLCYAGAVLHARPSPLAASRCPIMVGTELFGEPSVDGDIEVASLMLDSLRAVESALNDQSCSSRQLQRLTIDLGHVAIYRALTTRITQCNPNCSDDSLQQLFDAVQRKSAPDLQQLLPQIVDDQALATIIAQLPSLCGDVSLLDRAREILLPLGEGVSSALDQLQLIAEVIAQRFPDVAIYLDLGELRGYGYHSGVVFAAYAEGFGEALANGGRYDGVGEVFGATRPATGFNTDIKALIRYFFEPVDSDEVATSGVKASPYRHIAAPQVYEQALWAMVNSLRDDGEVVVFAASNMLSKYDRVLEKQSGQWSVVDKNV